MKLELKNTIKVLFICVSFLVELISGIVQKFCAELPMIPNLGGNSGRLAMRVTLGFVKQKLNKKYNNVVTVI